MGGVWYYGSLAAMRNKIKVLIAKAQAKRKPVRKPLKAGRLAVARSPQAIILRKMIRENAKKMGLPRGFYYLPDQSMKQTQKDIEDLAMFELLDKINSNE